MFTGLYVIIVEKGAQLEEQCLATPCKWPVTVLLKPAGCQSYLWGQVTAGWVTGGGQQLVTGRGQQPLPLGWPTLGLAGGLPWHLASSCLFSDLNPLQAKHFSLCFSHSSPGVFLSWAQLCEEGKHPVYLPCMETCCFLRAAWAPRCSSSLFPVSWAPRCSSSLSPWTEHPGVHPAFPCELSTQVFIQPSPMGFAAHALSDPWHSGIPNPK